MNNSQFRNLLFDKDKPQDNGTPKPTSGTKSSSLGSKKAGFMPMTTRTVKGGIDVDFARQVRERNAALQPTKKHKTAVPKGVKYGSAYTDRAKARAEAEAEGAEDDKESRVKALEEQMRLGQISEEMFEALRDKIIGGDVGSTHLVKGLDRKLLERVRRGEDVLGTGEGAQSSEPAPDVDDELDKLGEKEVEAVQREKVEKRGVMAPPSLAGKKRSRDELMAELKAQRKATAEAKAAPLLSGKWKKVGEEQKSRVEIDHKGREVLITVDEDGMVKKKVRKAKPQEAGKNEAAIAMPDLDKAVLGSDVAVPEAAVTAPNDEDEDDDIFEGVGTAYNPLGDEVDESDGSNSSDEADEFKEKPTTQPSLLEKDQSSDSEDGGEEAVEPRAATRNYFGDAKATNAEEASIDRQSGIQDLLKKAAKMDPLKDDNDEGTGTNEAEKARLKRRAEMLAQQDRDVDDMDMGFGSSRYEDEGEEDGKKMKLSEWKGTAGGDDDGGEENTKGAGKKKRKPKKRKGDVNNAADIFRVIEGRKSGK